jgi:hypothetical protein
MLDDKLQQTDVYDFGFWIFSISDLGFRIVDFKKGKKPYFNP